MSPHRVTQHDIHDDSKSTVGASSNWERGIAGRGVLVDYYSWACENAIEYDAVGNYACSLDHIKEIIKEKDISLHQGDIIFIRTGKPMDFSPGPSALCPRADLVVAPQDLSLDTRS